MNSSARRTADLALALVAAVVVLPLVIVVAVILLLLEGRPILFSQERIGRAGAPFRIHKFRTMRVAEDEVAGLLDGGARVTRFGELLRRSSIDELPSLWDVLRGRMSLIGPRPLLAAHVPLYAATHPERLLVRPGLTGAAQVSGRKDLGFRARLDRDVDYVRTASPAQDLRIIALTVATVLRSLRRPSEGGLAAVDDIGLADAILEGAHPGVWEHGSFLEPHDPVGSEPSVLAERTSAGGAVAPSVRAPSLHGGAVVFGTARQALVTLARGAGRVLVPSYYCPDVTETLRRAGVAVVEYPDDPRAGPSVVHGHDDDLVVVLPHFGRPTRVSVTGGRLLLDVSHALGLDGRGLTTDADGRAADLLLASLRKTLPVPDGALLWASDPGILPPQPPLAPHHAAAARTFADAMQRKAAYLQGEPVRKADFLDLAQRAVRALEEDVSPSAALPETVVALTMFDLDARWHQRDRNRAAAMERLAAAGAIGGEGSLEVLDAPFLLVLLAGTPEAREALRLGLIARDVYPAVLWPQPSAAPGSAERDFAERMLALHVDARYGPDDLRRVADLVAEVWQGIRAEARS